MNTLQPVWSIDVTRLMKLLKYLARFLKAGPNRPYYVPSARRYKPVDVERLRHELRLDVRARQNGKHNLPRTESTSLDPVERQIIEKFEVERKTQLDDFLQELKVRDDRIADYRSGPAPVEIAAIGESAEARFKALCKRQLEKLHQRAQDLREREAEFQHFRRAHALARPARYPLSKLWHGAILVLVFTVESILNGSVLALGSEGGILGGILLAAALALVNVGSGFFIGRFMIPGCTYRGLLRRVFSLSSTPVLILAFTLGFNFLVAHYREAMVTGSNLTGTPVSTVAPYPRSDTAQLDWSTQDMGRAAFYRAVHDPLSIGDFNSVLLLLMGCAFSLIAMADGYKWDDPYPGYGPQDRRRRAAEDEYVSVKDLAFEDIEHIREETLEEIDRIVDELERRRSTYESLCHLRDSEARQFTAHLRYLEATGDSLLKTYRTLNRSVRTSPAPAYFDTPFRFSSAPEDDIPQPAAVSSGSRHFDTRVFEEAQRARTTLLSAHSQAFAAFTDVGDVTREPVLSVATR